MRFEALEGIFPHHPDEVDNLIRVISLLRSEHTDKSPLVLFTWKMRQWGGLGIRKTQQLIETQLTPAESLHPDHPVFKTFSDLALPPAMLVYAGSAIEGLDEAMWKNGVFSVKNYTSRCNDGVTGTLYPMIKYLEGSVDDEVIDTRAMLPFLIMDKTFEEVLRRRDLLPRTLQRHFYQGEIGTRDCFLRILNLCRPVARAVLELTPARVG